MLLRINKNEKTKIAIWFSVKLFLFAPMIGPPRYLWFHKMRSKVYLAF